MAGNVVQFPFRDVKAWVDYSRELKSLALKAGMAASEIDEFITHFKATYESFKFDYSMTFNFETQTQENHVLEQIDGFNKYAQKYVNDRIIDRFMRDLVVYIRTKGQL